MALALAGPAAAAGDADREATAPLAVRDQNPLLRGVYLPMPGRLPAAGEGWRLETGLQWSNTVNVDAGPGERLVVDAEAAELDLALTRSAGPWRLRAQLPVTYRGAGVLDGFIDGWHRFFGLPKGDRPLFPRNSYTLEYARTGGPAFAVERGTSLGDLALEGARVLVDTPERSLAAWLGVELPTGSRAHSTGNGTVDVAGWLSGDVALGERVRLSGQVGVVVPGRGDPLPAPRAAGFGTLAVGWRLGRSFTALAQLDGHSRLARDSNARFLQAPTILTLGGRIGLRSGATFEAGVSEDVAVDRSPDVSFHVGFHWPAFR
jgi:hypothetical protein